MIRPSKLPQQQRQQQQPSLRVHEDEDRDSNNGNNNNNNNNIHYSSTKKTTTKRPHYHDYNSMVLLFLLLVLATILFVLVGYYQTSWTTNSTRFELQQLRKERSKLRQLRPSVMQLTFTNDTWLEWTLQKQRQHQQQQQQYRQKSLCPIQTFRDLSIDELYPTQGIRHIVTPPKGGLHSLACCTTTAGFLSFVIHHNWAPYGAQRAKEMITKGYFSTWGQQLQQFHATTTTTRTNQTIPKPQQQQPQQPQQFGTVPFAKCVANIICQFGLHIDPNISQTMFTTLIPDDRPNWLPQGDVNGKIGTTKRFAKGYLAFAGSDSSTSKRTTRGKQWFVSLDDLEELGGFNPWEIPFGELVGNYSYTTIDTIYTGYGVDGPSQSTLKEEGMSPEVQEKFPMLDYITSCAIVEERIIRTHAKGYQKESPLFNKRN